MCWSSRIMTFRFDSKTQRQIFLLLFGGASSGGLTGRLHTKLGEFVYISIIYHILACWLKLLNGYDFYFWWRDTANQILPVSLNPLSQGDRRLSLSSHRIIFHKEQLESGFVETIRTISRASYIPIHSTLTLKPNPFPLWFALCVSCASAMKKPRWMENRIQVTILVTYEFTSYQFLVQCIIKKKTTVDKKC